MRYLCILLLLACCGCGNSQSENGQPAAPTELVASEAQPQPTPQTGEITAPPTSTIGPLGYELQNAPGVVVMLGMEYDDFLKTLRIKGVGYDEVYWDDVLGIDTEDPTISIGGGVDERLHFRNGELSMARWVNERGKIDDLDMDGHAMETIRRQGELPVYYEYFQEENYRFGNGHTVLAQVHRMDIISEDWIIYTTLQRDADALDYEEWEQSEYISRDELKNAKIFEDGDPSVFAVLANIENPISRAEADGVIEREHAEAIADEEWPLTYGYGGVAIYHGKPYYFYQLRNLVMDEGGEISHSSYATDMYIPLDGGEPLYGFHQRIGLE